MEKHIVAILHTMSNWLLVIGLCFLFGAAFLWLPLNLCFNISSKLTGLVGFAGGVMALFGLTLNFLT